MMLERITNDSIVHEVKVDNGYINYSERPETFIVPIVFGIIFLVGVIGNGCLIYILCRHKTMRSVPNTFIFNLALGDLLVLVFSVPFTSTIYTLDSWPYGEFVCKASEFAKDTSVGVSVFTLTALSLDRYTAIVRPVQSFVGGPKSTLVIICLVCIWVVSLGLALPAALFSRLITMPGPPIPLEERIVADNGTLIGPTHREFFICYPFPFEFGPIYPKIVVVTRAVIHYCLPLLIIGTFYATMAHHLLRSVQAIPGQATLTTASAQRHRHPSETQSKTEPASLLPQQQQPSQNRARRKVAKMVLSFVVLFAVCFLPIHVFMLWFYFDPKSHDNYGLFWHYFKIIGFNLAYINSCTNPIALYCVSTSFRKHFNRLLCCFKSASTEPVSGICGSMCAGPVAYSRDDAVLTDERVGSSSGTSNFNSRRTIVTTHTRSFRTPGVSGSSSVRRNPLENEGYPLNEFTRQHTTGPEQTAC